MLEEKVKKELEELITAEVKLNESMKNHTTFKIGGNADIFIEVKSVADLKNILVIAKKHNMPITILANGSNLLVRDGGIRGIVIKIKFDSIKIEKSEEDEEIYNLTAYSGANLMEVCQRAAEAGIGPVHEIYGIPASVGGAVKMNAGAYGTEMKDLVYETCYMDYDGNMHKVIGDEHNFGYRGSIFSFKKVILIYSVFKLRKVEDPEFQAKEMERILNLRAEKQPLDYPSAGSTFKRGEDYIASLLIDQCGLKGRSVGGAEVSKKHGGFVLNKGNATAKDVLDLVSEVKKEVFKQKNKVLEMEVIVIGEEKER